VGSFAFTLQLNNLQVDLACGETPPTMVIPAQPDETYNAAQFHLHLASEHTINGLFSSAGK